MKSIMEQTIIIVSVLVSIYLFIYFQLFWISLMFFIENDSTDLLSAKFLLMPRHTYT